MAALDDTNHGARGFSITRVKALVQYLQSKYKMGQKRKNSLSAAPGSQPRQVQNLINMMVSVGTGPSSLSWLAQRSADGWEVECPDRVLGGTTIEVGESTPRVDSLK